MKAKSIWASKTFWFAVLKAVGGVLTVVLAENPELKIAGSLAMVVAALDMMLRMITNKPVEI